MACVLVGEVDSKTQTVDLCSIEDSVERLHTPEGRPVELLVEVEGFETYWWLLEKSRKTKLDESANFTLLTLVLQQHAFTEVVIATVIVKAPFQSMY